MKKKLVVLLAVVMMFAFSASAYAATFSDVSERPVVEQDAIKKAVALGIIEGYEDGTFGPDKTITRAEFAKIAVTAAGAKDTATMLEANASSFKDVKANSWYTGWINAAESLGIFKGDSNGNFRPNDTISNQEAITVLMRLLGYNDNLTGAWPVNYVTKANQINILDDVNIVASAAAKRGDITVMLDATLDSDIVTYDKDTNEFVKKQTRISDSDFITLLEDSFEGAFLKVDSFPRVQQVRDASAKTLNWPVVGIDTNSSTGKTSYNFIIDADTAVSYNAESMFDLENHQGKVYFVKETDGKVYARFIEVESYVQKVSDQPTAPSTSTVKVGTTNYNALNPEFSTFVNNNRKNSSFYMYFNDDDQVYKVVSDKDYAEKAYYVKNVNNSSVRLVGTTSQTANMNDADTLIWDGDKFIAPSDLKVGDAIMEITPGDLYVKIDDKSGTLTRATTGNSGTPTSHVQYKATIGGSNYVYNEYVTGDEPTAFPTPAFYEEDLESASVALDDVYNNNVRFVQDKDNVIAAIIVDETSTGTTLYGIMMDGDAGGSIANRTSSVTLFTQEGNNVTYDYAKDVNGDKLTGANIGQLIEYKLNSNGEIKTVDVVDTGFGYDVQRGAGTLTATATPKIEVENNSYLKTNASNIATLAANVIIFEVASDDGDVDPSVITRSALLGGGDFTPETVQFNNIYVNGSTTNVATNYAVYKTNTNGAIKVLAYTEASGSNYHYGVIKTWKFIDADHAGGNDFAVTLVGDDAVYDLGNPNAEGGNDRFVIYQLSGDKLTVVKTFQNDGKLAEFTRQVTGYNDGLITVNGGWTAAGEGVMDKNNIEFNPESKPADNKVYSVATDANTVVYIIDANSGDYKEGALSDISRNAWVYIPVVDEDGYADVVLIDEYPRNTNSGGNPGAVTGITPTWNYVIVTSNGNTINAGSATPANVNARVNASQSGNTITVRPTVTTTGDTYLTSSITVTYNGIPLQCTSGNAVTFTAQDGAAAPVITVTLVRN